MIKNIPTAAKIGNATKHKSMWGKGLTTRGLGRNLKKKL
jgi:hypothetical protein